MPTDSELINNIYSGLYVGGEYTTLLGTALLTNKNLILANKGYIDSLSDYLHSTDGLGDIRFWASAMYTAVVTADLAGKVNAIYASAALADPGTPVKLIKTQTEDIQFNTDKIPDIITHTTQIALDTVEIIAGIATAETGIGVAIAALGIINLANDAIKLQNDFIKDKVDGIPFISEDVTDLANQISDLSDLLTSYGINIGLIKRLHQILTGTDWNGYTLRLDEGVRSNALFGTRNLVRYQKLSDYLSLSLLAAPPAGHYELGEVTVGTGTFEVPIDYCYGVQVDFTSIPSFIARYGTAPYRYGKLGHLSFGRMGGYHGLELIRYSPSVIMPIPAGTESIRLELLPDLEASVSTIVAIEEGI